jgi:hypothetical protein
VYSLNVCDISIYERNPYTVLDSPLVLQKAEARRFSRESAHEGGMVVSPTTPLPPRRFSWYTFLLEAMSTPGSCLSIRNPDQPLENRKYVEYLSLVMRLLKMATWVVETCRSYGMRVMCLCTRVCMCWFLYHIYCLIYFSYKLILYIYWWIDVKD